MESNSREAIDLTKLRFAVILNKSSGSCDDTCADKLSKILNEAKINPVSFLLVEGKEVETALVETLAQEIDVLVILGGDGTVRSAGEHCVDSRTKLLPLPGGTMNMLAKALYGNEAWDFILARTLSVPVFQGVSAGSVEGHFFFCAAIFGSAALWSNAREAARSNQWIRAIQAALFAYRQAFSRKISFSLDRAANARATVVSVICPLVSAAVPSEMPSLEVAVMSPDTISDAFHLAWSAALSDWRNDANVSSRRATQIELSAASAIPAILDGERVTLKSTSEIKFHARAFVAVVPSA